MEKGAGKGDEGDRETVIEDGAANGDTHGGEEDRGGEDEGGREESGGGEGQCVIFGRLEGAVGRGERR